MSGFYVIFAEMGSNFEIGGGGSTNTDSILGGHKTLFLTDSL